MTEKTPNTLDGGGMRGSFQTREETEYEDVETEHAEEVEYGDILQQITPSKGPQGEEQSQESSKVHFDVLSAAKILADAS
ncbi:hypothetical protein Tco_0970731 [Tanacetum coccineum]